MIRVLHILLILFSGACLFASSCYAHQHLPCCTSKPNAFQRVGNRLIQIWTHGRTELYIPTYAWHNRYLYTPERIRTYNEIPWGTGLGKSFYDEDGDWHGLYAFAFLDSHKNLEPAVGYAFLKNYHFNAYSSIGLGFTALVTARPDIMHNIPFGGVLPWVGVSYKRVSLAATYIPGAKGAGNVLFLVTKFLI